METSGPGPRTGSTRGLADSAFSWHQHLLSCYWPGRLPGSGRSFERPFGLPLVWSLSHLGAENTDSALLSLVTDSVCLFRIRREAESK